MAKIAQKEGKMNAVWPYFCSYVFVYMLNMD